MAHLRVVTWNAEGMFVEGTKTRRASPHEAVEVLKVLNGDIVVIPEFGKLADLKEEISRAIGALGYQVTMLAYDEPRTPGLGFAILSRLPVHNSSILTLAGSKRQVLELVCHDAGGTTLRILGVHLDDRSEAGRMNEVAALAEHIRQREDAHLLMLGDFNAMNRNSRFAKLARTSLVSLIAKHINHTQIKSMATRVQEMAMGTTIEYLVSHTNLHDLDLGRKPTISGKQAGLEWAPKFRLAKIDWIFGSHQFRTIAYKVYSDVGSDHRPVVADVEY